MGATEEVITSQSLVTCLRGHVDDPSQHRFSTSNEDVDAVVVADDVVFLFADRRRRTQPSDRSASSALAESLPGSAR
jgi:hypothetical protein